MKRLKQISEQIKENINQFIEAADNNESPLDKTIVDMKERIAEAKELISTEIATLSSLRHAYQEAADKVKVWDEKEAAALQDDNTEHANEAQQRKQQHLQRANDLEQQIQTQEAVVDDFKTALKEFYQQFRNASEQIKTLSQRQKQAETRAAFYKLLAEFELPDANIAFQQAEQVLKNTEAEAKMWEKRNRRTTVQSEPAKKDSDLDEALATLKKDVLGSESK